MKRPTETLASLDQPPAVRRASWLAALPAGADLSTAAAGVPNTQAYTNAEASREASAGRRGSAPAPIAGDVVSTLLEQAHALLKAECARPSAPASIRWLCDGLDGYIKEGKAGTLERHLGLNVAQHRGRSVVRLRVVQKRWDALGAAYAAQIDCGALAPLRRCAILVDDLDAFEKAFWPHWRRNGLPKSPSQLRRALYGVFVAYDGAPPREPRNIYQALQRAKIIGSSSDSHE